MVGFGEKCKLVITVPESQQFEQRGKDSGIDGTGGMVMIRA